MANVTCPSCQEQIEIDDDWFGTKIACPLCDHHFRPERPRRVATRIASSSSQEDRGEDEPRRNPTRRITSEKTQRSTRVFFIVFLSLLGIGALGCFGLCGWGYYYVTSPAKFAGPWIKQTLPDGSASMMFPAPPKTEPIPSANGAANGTNYLYVANLPRDVGLSFGVLDIPDGDINRFDLFCDECDKELQNDVGVPVRRAQSHVVQGFKARDSNLDAGGPSPGVIRYIAVPRPIGFRVLMIVAAGRNLSKEDQEKFLNSLTIQKKGN